MNSNMIKHLKMINGEELICEFIDDDEEEDSIVVRHAYSLSSEVDHERGVRYYTFRPYMMYQEGADQFIIINASGILALSLPSLLIKDQYFSYINIREKELSSEIKSVNDTIDNMLSEFDSDKKASSNVIKLH